MSTAVDLPTIPENSCDNLSARDQRSLILHVLYAMDSFDYGVSLESILDNFSRGFNCTLVPDSAITARAQAIIEKRGELDEQIKPLLDNWKFERIGCCTKLILRIALWELMHTDTDAAVILNEAIELGKCFSEADAHKFINGILDKWVKEHKGIDVSPLSIDGDEE